MSNDEELQQAFVAAFAPYVRSRLSEAFGNQIADDATVIAAIDAGAKWLEGELAALFASDPASQRQSPLALFQAALAYPTQALEVLGCEPVARDAAAVAALPGDLYDLAPASSQALGETAWRAHVDWGIRKAAAVAGVVPASTSAGATPTVALVGNDLMDRSKIESAVRHAGLDFVAWRNPGAVSSGLDATLPAVVFVDLTHPAADEVITLIASLGVAVVAFGPHVDDFAMARASALGAAKVVPRSRFFAKLPDYLPDVT